MKTITVTDDEYRKIQDCLPYYADQSYALQVAYIIKNAIQRGAEPEPE